MAELPNPTDTRIVDAIYEHHESQREPPRPYLGASEIGESCERRLWYSFRWAAPEEFPGRMLRLFETGQLEEERVYRELRAIGLEIKDVDPDTGRQWRFADIGGHLSGGCDGMVLGVPGAEKTWHLLEIKTHNAKSFKALLKDGVRKSKPKHYEQIQTYMSKFGLKRGLYFAKNKDTDELYTERVRLDADEAERIRNKALRVIQASEPLSKISENPSWYECKFCPAKKTCHGQQVAQVSCRTCVHATPVPDGDRRWVCERYGVDIPEDKQRTGCLNHLHIPSLVPFAEAVEAGDDWIKYRKNDGAEFFAVGEAGFPADDLPHYSSRELAAVSPESIGDPAVEAARTELEGRSVG